MCPVCYSTNIVLVNLPRKPAIQRNSSTEKFQAAGSKVQLVNKIVKRMQFHTTRTVARAITGPGRESSREVRTVNQPALVVRLLEI